MSCFAITSSHPRHTRFLETICSKADLRLIIIVPKSGEPSAVEHEHFTSSLSLGDEVSVLTCTAEQLHTAMLGEIRRISPSVGFVFGAPLLSESVFSIPQYGCVNIHTGLVGHYRGVDSTMWAMHDNRPDLIGATLHYVDNTIDAGAVIGMKTVTIEKDDNLDTLFYKSCQAGFDLLSEQIDAIMLNNVEKFKLQSKGKLYQNRDRSPKIRAIAQDNLRKYKSENYFRSL